MKREEAFNIISGHFDDTNRMQVFSFTWSELEDFIIKLETTDKVQRLVKSYTNEKKGRERMRKLYAEKLHILEGH